MIRAGARRQHDLDLSVSHGRLGQANYQLGNVPAARDAFRKSLEISLRLAQADEADVDALKASAYSFGVLGLLERSVDEFAEASMWFEQGIQLLEKAEKAGQFVGQPIYLGWLAEQREALESCRLALKAIGDFQFALSRPENEIPGMLALRSRVLARRGQHFHAKATADLLATLEPTTAENLFHAAEGYALCVGGMKPVPPDTALSADDVALQARYAKQASELLKRADFAGYFNTVERAIQLENSPNLDPLRARDDFQKLLDGLWIPETEADSAEENGIPERSDVDTATVATLDLTS